MMHRNESHHEYVNRMLDEIEDSKSGNRFQDHSRLALDMSKKLGIDFDQLIKSGKPFNEAYGYVLDNTLMPTRMISMIRCWSTLASANTPLSLPCAFFAGGLFAFHVAFPRNSLNLRLREHAGSRCN